MKSALSSGTLGCALLVLAHGQGKAGRYVLNEADVVKALNVAGVAVVELDIRMPTTLKCTQEAPPLKLGGAELLEDGRLRVRLVSVSMGVCQPFTVELNTPNAALALEQATHSLREAAENSARSSAQMTGMKVGDRVELRMEDQHMRIALPVVLLDSGQVGTEVRVSSLDHKQIFVARVESTNVVRGAFP